MDPKQSQQGHGNDPQKRQGQQQADRPQGNNPEQEHRSPGQGNNPSYGNNPSHKPESEQQKGDRNR
jgi:hypothetical protein